MEKIRVAIVASHPIQHFCPQYVSIAQSGDIDVKVFFGSALGYKKYVDPSFGKEISWGNLGLDQFDHVFLNGEVVLPADKNLDAVSLDAELDKFRPDVVIVYGYFQRIQRRAFRWARRNKVRLAYISDSERRRSRSRIKEWIKYPFVSWYFSRIDFFLTVGNANEELYIYYGVPADKFIRMHFPIDIRSYEEAYANRGALGEAVRQGSGIGKGEIVLSVAGKLVSGKRQIDIIDAMHLLEEQQLYFHLLVMGSGEMMNELQQKAASLKRSKVHFAGFVNADELPGYYAATDIYVHPSVADAHSLAISEAIYMDCPVVLSDRCGSYGQSDDVQEERNGYVFKCGDVAELAARIAGLAQADEKRKEFGRYSHDIAVQFQRRAHLGYINELKSRLHS